MHRNGSDLTKADKIKLISGNDIILIIVLLLAAVCVLLYMHMSQKDGNYVEVTIDSKVYGDYLLDKDQQISIEGEDFVSILTIKGGEASMTEADCPDQICVNHSPISHGGETIVCLPHKVVCEVIAGDVKDDDSMDAIAK